MIFKMSWQRYLSIIFLAFGVGQLGLALISWVAANWQHWSIFQKLYSVQALVVLLMLVTQYGIYRSRNNLVANKNWLSQFSSLLLAVSFGGLFALFGQSYQTGADIWELFALWSLVQLPLLFYFANIGSAILFICTLNLALLFFLEYNFIPTLRWSNNLDWSVRFVSQLPVALLNLVIIVICERWGHLLNDHHRTTARFANIALILSWCRVVIFGIDENTLAITILVYAIGFIYYFVRRDILLAVLYFIGMIGMGDTWILMSSSDFTGGLLSAILCTLFAFWLLIVYGRNYYLKSQPELADHWAFNLGSSIILMFVTILVLVFMWFVFQDFYALWVGAFIFTALGTRYFFNKGYIYAVSLGLGQALAMFATLGMELSVLSEVSGPMLLVSVIYTGFFFIFALPQWLRILSLATSIYCFFYSTIYHLAVLELEWLSFNFYFIAVCLLIICMSFIWLSLNSARHQSRIMALVWGILLYFAASEIWTTHLMYYSSMELSELSQDDFIKMLFRFFMPSQWNDFTINFIFYWGIFICCLVALVYRVYQQGFDGVKATKLIFAMVLLTVVLLITRVWWPIYLLFIAYFMPSRALLGFCILMLMHNWLWRFYYYEPLPFDYKALMCLAVGLASLFCYLLVREAPQTETNEEQNTTKSGKVKFAYLVLLVLTGGVLTSVNMKMMQYNAVLNEGESVILEIEPIDPRSLLQGDYMVLNYAILNNIERQDDFPKKFYALIQRNEQGIVDICRMSDTVPTDFSGCVPNVYLPLKTDGWQTRLPSQDYFFPSGKEKYYSTAAYAEYRFKDGVLLLARLLDEHLKPLTLESVTAEKEKGEEKEE